MLNSQVPLKQLLLWVHSTANLVSAGAGRSSLCLEMAAGLQKRQCNTKKTRKSSATHISSFKNEVLSIRFVGNANWIPGSTASTSPPKQDSKTQETQNIPANSFEEFHSFFAFHPESKIHMHPVAQNSRTEGSKILNPVLFCTSRGAMCVGSAQV